ncbi:Aste57867_12232 [Aphanomyces stellatus]|uniref:Aste57867_12232 protein n=1 Tax=Aphanomyces stellatus TaxID=120398 RepID=A0A485KV24_9STRA|nr:hypothetical protein As57867_012187 [Aphanomyces stellatus]VFT89086.1 Aste57867_12232 [Aphanomyces stellatus]
MAGIAPPSMAPGAVLPLLVPSSDCLFGPDHCFHPTSPALLCAYVYAAAASFALVVNVHRASRLREHGRDSSLAPARRMRFFPFLLFVAFAFRTTWYLLQDCQALQERTDPAAGWTHQVVVVGGATIDLYTLAVVSWDKFATLVYFSAFSLLAQFWGDVLHHAAAASSSRHRVTVAAALQPTRHNNLLAIVNVWMYILEFILLLLKTFQLGQGPSMYLMYSDGIVVALFYGALAVVLGMYAYSLPQALGQSDAASSSSFMVLQSLSTRITFLGFLCTGLFLMRAILFLFSPKQTLNVAYFWIYYAMPEVIPGCAVLILMRVKSDVVAQDQKSSSIAVAIPAAPVVSERGFLLHHKDILSI